MQLAALSRQGHASATGPTLGEPTMGRTLLGILLGSIVMWLTIFCLELLGHALFPPPAGLDPQNPEHLKRIIADAPTGAMAMLVLAWAAGAFTGAWTAARIARHPRAAAVLIALVVMSGVIGMMLIVPEHPKWVSGLGLLLPIPVALIAARVAGWRGKGFAEVIGPLAP
jgi:hypothetical protein